MRFDLSNLRLTSPAFSNEPNSFCNHEPIAHLARLIQFGVIEFGRRDTRHHWQRSQLQNLFDHASEKSKFWQQRLSSSSARELTDLPVLTRRQVQQQVESEGSLIGPSDNVTVLKGESSGSTGHPLTFYKTGKQAAYVGARCSAQFIFERLPIEDNITRLSFDLDASPASITESLNDPWLGPLSAYTGVGKSRNLKYHPAVDPEVLAEALTKDRIGYLVAAPWVVEALLTATSVQRLVSAGLRMWIPFAGAVPPHIRSLFEEHSILVRSNYSSEEFGPIGFECPHNTGYYHVATSNVVVECLQGATELDGIPLSRILVTGLHSYATPFIRYDIGDLGVLHAECPCGHQGEVLSNVYGRTRQLLKRPDGTLRPFYLNSDVLRSVIQCDEYRVNQISPDRVEIEIGGREIITEAEVGSIQALLREYTGPDVSIHVLGTQQINWGRTWKRLNFRSSIL